MAPPPLNLLAQAVRLFGMGQLEPAAQACTTMARLQPNSADPLYLLGVIRDRQGRAGEAVDSFTRFVTLKRAVNPRRRSFEDHRNLGIALARLQQHDGAVESFRAALALRPDDADVHRSLGIVLATAGRFEAAVASFEKALAIRPDAQVYSLLGDAQRQLRRYDAAIASFRKALAIDPAAADAHAGLGVAQLEMGDPEAAIASFRNALAAQSEQRGHPFQSRCHAEARRPARRGHRKPAECGRDQPRPCPGTEQSRQFAEAGGAVRRGTCLLREDTGRARQPRERTEHARAHQAADLRLA